MSPRKRSGPYPSRWPAALLVVTLVCTGAGWATQFSASAPERGPAGEVRAREAGQLLVVNKSGHSLSILDPASGDERARIPTGRSPHEVAVAPDGDRAYVTDYGSGDRPGSTVTVVEHLRTGAGAEGMDASADGERVYVVNREAGTLSEISVSGGEVTRTLEVGRFPIRVTVVPGGEELLVSDARANEVVRVDVDAWEVTGHLTAGEEPDGMAWVSGGAR